MTFVLGLAIGAVVALVIVGGVWLARNQVEDSITIPDDWDD